MTSDLQVRVDEPIAGLADGPALYVMVAVLLPQKLGIGKLQPLVRFQGASPRNDAVSNAVIVGGQLQK